MKLSKLIRLQRYLSKTGQVKAFWALDKLLVTAAEKDAKDLIQLNLNKLKGQTPMPEGISPKEFYISLQEQAKTGPIFSGAIIEFVRDTPEHMFPAQNRKGFVKWWVNALAGWMPPTARQDQILAGNIRGLLTENLTYIKDWLNGVDWPQAEVNLEGLTLTQAIEQARLWHEQQFQNPSNKEKVGPYQTKDVIYQFKNGFTLVRVPPADLGTEGELMGHCVGGYCEFVQKGDTQIYSLRDPQNNPHVTFEVRGKQVYQIKGKKNEPPTGKYSGMVREFLSQTDWNYEKNRDYEKMPISEEEAMKFKKEDPLSFLAHNMHLEYPEMIDEKMATFTVNALRENPELYPGIILTRSLAQKIDQDTMEDLFLSTYPQTLLPKFEWPAKYDNRYDPIEDDKQREKAGHFYYTTIDFFIENLKPEKLKEISEKDPIAALALTNSYLEEQQELLQKCPELFMNIFDKDRDSLIEGAGKKIHNFSPNGLGELTRMVTMKLPTLLPNLQKEKPEVFNKIADFLIEEDPTLVANYNLNWPTEILLKATDRAVKYFTGHSPYVSEWGDTDSWHRGFKRFIRDWAHMIDGRTWKSNSAKQILVINQLIGRIQNNEDLMDDREFKHIIPIRVDDIIDKAIMFLVDREAFKPDKILDLAEQEALDFLSDPKTYYGLLVLRGYKDDWEPIAKILSKKILDRTYYDSVHSKTTEAIREHLGLGPTPDDEIPF